MTSLASSDKHQDMALSVDGRPVLQPACNRVFIPNLERRSSLKKISPPPPPPPPPPPSRATSTSTTTGNGRIRAPSILSSGPSPTSPKLRSPRLPAVKRLGSETSGLTSSVERLIIPKSTTPTTKSTPALERKKSKKFSSGGGGAGHAVENDNAVKLSIERSLLRSYSSSLIIEAPGSIAAVRREQMALQHAQRKMKIAHYGRSKSAKFDSSRAHEANKIVPSVDSLSSVNVKTANTASTVEEKRCSFITPNSDPIYVAYHDEEWGVPTHDDKSLFELLVLSGAQVGSDWTSILKKRQDFKKAFLEFDAVLVANFTEKQIISMSTSYNFDLGRVRGVVDNATRILEIKKEFGSFDKYIWGFVNNKPISPQYKFGHKIPVKTSKSEGISKDMVRRGFRFTGPTVVHSFMQAAGLTNDHLISCHRQLQCTALSTAKPHFVKKN